MNSTLSNVIMFAVGAAIGSAVTWKVVKSKYERIANEEIAEMRNYVRDKFEPKKFEPKVFEPKNFEKDQVKYVNLTADYLRTFEEEEKGGAEDMVDENKPYVIQPEEFGEKDGYDTVSLTHYADGVLEDDQCNIIDNPDEIVGEGYADHFGEFEEDSVYVRNDELKIDYEILLDIRTYEAANSIGSYRSDE